MTTAGQTQPRPKRTHQTVRREMTSDGLVSVGQSKSCALTALAETMQGPARPVLTDKQTNVCGATK
jgi:hypothetical protein